MSRAALAWRTVEMWRILRGMSRTQARQALGQPYHRMRRLQRGEAGDQVIAHVMRALESEGGLWEKRARQVRYLSNPPRIIL